VNSRRTAAFVVARWLATHEFPNEMLPKGGPDRAFVQDLVYTTVRRFRPLRAVLGELLKTWPKGELEALVLVGAAQILYMPDVPDFAAVNETVAAAKLGDRGKRLDRVVNGVLRNLLRRRAEFEAKLAAAPLAERESFPNALVSRWTERYGAEGAEKLARWHNTPAETWLARKGSFEKLPRGEKVADQPGFAEGAFIVQDPATAGAVDLLDVSTGKMPVVPGEGLSVLDFCAAPGGKTVQIAWRMGMGRSGETPLPLGGHESHGSGRACRDQNSITAQEVNPKRLARLKENLARMKLDNVIAVSQVEDGALFDRVLVDAPCSNTGVIRRRPDARWRWNADHLAQLVALQRDILEAAAAHVKQGGRLVYSTCSNEPEENAEQIAAFLAAHPDFTEVGRYESVPFETGHDGAFACALVRSGDSNITPSVMNDFSHKEHKETQR
jgi:16S rRNA (cytosine967-C5)-methyltransferase